MPFRLRVLGSGVLDEWELFSGEPCRRRAAGQLVPFASEVRLVGVAIPDGELGERRAPASWRRTASAFETPQRVPRLFEADDTQCLLGRDAIRTGETLR
jgi:hypothetical protein